jgi:regulator of protease activity HflC (stomatin/prohibitin superfamily)
MAVKNLAQYEQAVIFRLGRLLETRGPGLFFIIPFIDHMVKVDMREITIDIPSQVVVTPNRMSIQVSAKVRFKIVDAVSATTKVVDPIRTTTEVSRKNFRRLLENEAINELVQLDELSKTMQRSIEKETKAWGVELVEVELKKIE